jgi:hypothetical protein
MADNPSNHLHSIPFHSIPAGLPCGFFRLVTVSESRQLHRGESCFGHISAQMTHYGVFLLLHIDHFVARQNPVDILI